MELFRQHALEHQQVSKGWCVAEGPYPTGSRGCQDFIRLLSIQRDLEPHNGHPCSDPNQNHIGESPGANQLDHATHCSLASNSFIRESGLSSGIPSRQSMCYTLSICYSHCVHIVQASNVVSADHEEVPLHVLFVMGHLSYIVHAPCAITRLNTHKWEVIWWLGGLLVVTSAL